ncbi:MAG: aldo/keto reductase [Anaerolineae bacterium]|nr:aldo/keto reductase [Anaerolineae bacterium]
MVTRKLGKTNVQLTTIGMGTYALGGANWEYAWGEQDDRDSIAAIHRAFDLGINWIDVAPAYGLGHAETVVGKVLAERSDDIFVATKCGLVWQDGSPIIGFNLKAENIKWEAEQSLKRLNLEVIDLYQIHWPNPDEDIEDAWGAIADLIKEGKVRFGGVSNFNLLQMQRAQAIHPITSLQPPYSMVQRDFENDLLAYCAENEIGVIVYSPMESGLLTGKLTRQRLAELPDNDWRKTATPFVEPEITANLALVVGLRPIAERNGKSVAELAIAWTLRNPGITAAIVGARHPSQIEQTYAAADWALSMEEIAEIDRLLALRETALTSGR